MVLQLVKDKFGNYTYQSPTTMSTPNAASDASAFEAYEGGQKTTLAGTATDIGGETQKLLQRELPGQQELIIDPETGQAKAKGDIEKLGIDTSITSLETSTSEALQPKETPLDVAARIASLTKRQGTGTGVDVGALISRQQDLMKRQQDIGLISSGLNAYAAYKGYGMMTGGTIGGGAMSTAPITQLTQLGTTPIGASTVGGVGIAGAAGYGLGKVIGAKESEAQGMGAGAAIGMAVGGPVGAVIGGVAGGIFGCFLPDTLIKMADGSEKEIINIDLKDNIEVGGKVFATGKFLVNNLFDYKGIKVSGEHLVNENGKWLKVKDSKFSKSLGNDEHIVYTLGSENRRILINNILFTDYFDFEEQKTLAA